MGDFEKLMGKVHAAHSFPPESALRVQLVALSSFTLFGNQHPSAHGVSPANKTDSPSLLSVSFPFSFPWFLATAVLLSAYESGYSRCLDWLVSLSATSSRFIHVVD